MKTKLGVILMAAVIAISSAQAQPPPVKIDCSFYHVDFSKKSGYSNAKVAPKDMAWLKPGGTAFFGPGPDFDPNHQSSTGYVVLGWGIGHLTASTDLRKLTVQLAQVASDHRANAINYQMLNHGSRMRVEFLRLQDAYLYRARAHSTNWPASTGS